jgi:predicted transcriptional regulator/alkylated DNA nucleotide flippase Atl1
MEEDNSLLPPQRSQQPGQESLDDIIDSSVAEQGLLAGASGDASTHDDAAPESGEYTAKIKRKYSKRKSKHHPEIDRRLRGKYPPTLQELANLIGVSREAVRQYCERTNQEKIMHRRTQERLELEREAREGKKKQESLVKIIDHKKRCESIRRAVLIEFGDSGSWAVEQTIKFATRPRVNDWRGHYRVYSVYAAALARGKRLSYVAIAKRAGFRYEADVKAILDKPEDSPSLCWTIKTLPDHIKSLISRAYQVDMPERFIADVLRLTPYEIHSAFRVIANEPEKRQYNNSEDYDSRYLAYRGVSFSLASRVYKAQDAGLSLDDIAQRLSVDKKKLDFALSMRETVGPRLAAAIRTIYDVPEHDMPYMTEELHATLPK